MYLFLKADSNPPFKNFNLAIFQKPLFLYAETIWAYELGKVETQYSLGDKIGFGTCISSFPEGILMTCGNIGKNSFLKCFKNGQTDK